MFSDCHSTFTVTFWRNKLITATSDCCALSLQPFKNPVAVIAEPEPNSEGPLRADVFDLLNIVPYVRKFKTSGSDSYLDLRMC